MLLQHIVDDTRGDFGYGRAARPAAYEVQQDFGATLFPGHGLGGRFRRIGITQISGDGQHPIV